MTLNDFLEGSGDLSPLSGGWDEIVRRIVAGECPDWVGPKLAAKFYADGASYIESNTVSPPTEEWMDGFRCGPSLLRSRAAQLQHFFKGH